MSEEEPGTCPECEEPLGEDVSDTLPGYHEGCVDTCSGCGEAHPNSDLNSDLCEECRFTCDHCDGVWSVADRCGGTIWCTDCAAGCEECAQPVLREEAYSNGWSYYCDGCTYYCAECNRNYVGEDCGVKHVCECESPRLRFQVRNDGHGPLDEDRLALVGLPAGTVSEEGMEAIQAAVITYSFLNFESTDERQRWHRLAAKVPTMDPTWQTRRGNLTKRLSRMAYADFGLKVPPETLSQVGNIARDHSAGTDLRIRVTRDLNLPPEEFGHEDSCWWGSYSSSRCALKSNGGFGIRSFDDEDWVTGRCWVLPLRGTTRLRPTFETLHPDGFVVFNGYGDLSGYVGARVLAHLTGMTYRKVSLLVDEMYVNSAVGYLVAPEPLAAEYTDGSISLDLDPHSGLYHTERAEERRINEREMAHV